MTEGEPPRRFPPALVYVLIGTASVGVAGAAIWRLAVRGTDGPVLPAAPEGGVPPAAAPGAGAAPTHDELVASRYNAILQVRAAAADGSPLEVGAALPRRLSLEMRGEDGKTYAEPFDRVGQWAVEVPPGTYLIPVAQPGLGGWKWKLTGRGLRKVPGQGWRVVFEAGTMAPIIDVYLY